MSLITTTDQIKQYVSIAQSFQIEDFEPYETKAVNTFLKRYVGNLNETILNLTSEEEANTKIILEAKAHLESAICNLGMFLYMPYLSVQMDSSGISVVNNDQRSTAQWWQIKDIRRDLLRSGLESVDLLLDILEANLTLFTDYADNYTSVNNELLVSNAKTFSKYYNINDSRQTYIALQPTIRLVEDQYLHTMLCTELIEDLKGDTEALATLKTYLQKAIVAFTVSKVASIGVFSLDSTGLRVNYETFIDGRTEAVSSGKPSAQIQNLENELITNATNYLQLAKTHIQDNIETFTQCDNPLVNSNKVGSGYKSIDTRGVFGL